MLLTKTEIIIIFISDKLKKILGAGPANAVWSFFHHEPIRQFS
jgi:hypothetical protein